jgi:hypothetical protein
MPAYDYRCSSNGRVVEVTHSLRELMGCWGEVCERAGIELGDTDYDAQVYRIVKAEQNMIDGANALIGCGLAAGEIPPCMSGQHCHSSCSK